VIIRKKFQAPEARAVTATKVDCEAEEVQAEDTAIALGVADTVMDLKEAHREAL